MLERHYRLAGALVFLGLSVMGCAANVNDFKKQEFIVEKERPVHLALRGSREGGKVVCQAFLLTTSETMWISGADILLPDGTLVDPKGIESLEPESWSGPTFGFGFGYGTGYGYPGYPGYPYGRRYWYRGPYSCYRTSAGISVPAWYLLDHPSGRKTPPSIEFTYELPEAGSILDGAEFTVYIAVPKEEEGRKGEEKEGKGKEKGKKDKEKASKQKDKKKEVGRKKKDPEIAANEEKTLRLRFAFVLSQKVPSKSAEKKPQHPEKGVYELQFSPKKDEAGEGKPAKE